MCRALWLGTALKELPFSWESQVWKLAFTVQSAKCGRRAPEGYEAQRRAPNSEAQGGLLRGGGGQAVLEDTPDFRL